MSPVPHQDIIQHLEERGVRATAMRFLVFLELTKANEPLSLRQLEERMPTADRSTIFRTLTLLAEHSLVHCIQDGSGSTKYEACMGAHECTLSDQHPHFFCTRCHTTTCLTSMSIPTLKLPPGYVSKSVGFTVQGLCPHCARMEEE